MIQMSVYDIEVCLFLILSLCYRVTAYFKYELDRQHYLFVDENSWG